MVCSSDYVGCNVNDGCVDLQFELSLLIMLDILVIFFKGLSCFHHGACRNRVSVA